MRLSVPRNFYNDLMRRYGFEAEAFREAGVAMLNGTLVSPDPIADVRTLREWLG
jgi:hypothetical protein